MVAKKVEVIRKKHEGTPSNSVISKVDPEEVKLQIKLIVLSILKLSLQHVDKVEIEIIQGEKTTVFQVDLDPTDFGRLIGSKGRNIEVLRTIVGNIGAVHGFRAIFQVKDEERFF